MTSIVRVRPFSLSLHAPRGTHFTLVRLRGRCGSSPTLGPQARRTEQSRTIDRDSLNTYLRIVSWQSVEGGRIIETCVGAVECCVARRRRVWRKFAASKGINKAREANGVATCANEPDVLLPLTIVQYRGRHRPRNESLNRV